MKKLWILLTVLVLSVMLFACQEDVTSTYGLSYDQFDYISDYDEVFTQVEGTYLVYVYSPTCANCITIKTKVLQFANTYSEIKIYFFNPETASSEKKADYLTKIGQPDTYTPSLIVVIDNDFDNTNTSAYYFQGGTEVPNILKDIENGAYQYLK